MSLEARRRRMEKEEEEKKEEGGFERSAGPEGAEDLC